MMISTLFTKLACIMCCKKFANFWVPVFTGFCFVIFCFTDFFDVVFSTVFLELTKACLKMFTYHTFHFSISLIDFWTTKMCSQINQIDVTPVVFLLGPFRRYRSFKDYLGRALVKYLKTTLLFKLHLFTWVFYTVWYCHKITQPETKKNCNGLDLDYQILIRLLLQIRLVEVFCTSFINMPQKYNVCWVGQEAYFTLSWIPPQLFILAQRIFASPDHPTLVCV